MNVNLVSDRPASVSLLRILVMVLVGYVVMGNVVAILVLTLLVEGNLAEAIAQPLEHPEMRNILLLAQGLAALVGLVLIPWYYLRKYEHRSPRTLFKKLPTVAWIGLLAVVTLAFGLAISPVTEWNAEIQFPSWTGGLGDYLVSMEKQAEIFIKAFTDNLTPGSFVLVFVVMAILPGLGEEFVFRGLIQTELQRAFGNPHVAIWVAAGIFSAFHLQFFGFVPRVLIGALLGYLYYWSGNLWIPVFVHFLNNGLQVIALYLFQLGVHSIDVESTKSAPLPVVAVSVVAVAALLYYCKKNLTITFSLSRDNNT